MHKTSKAEFCRELRRTPSMSEVFVTLTTDDASVLHRKARRTAQQFVKLQRAAPRDIRSAVSEVASLASKIAKAVEDSPKDPQKIAVTLRAQSFDLVGSTRAAYELASYSTKTCHYNLNNAGIPTSTVIPPTGSPNSLPFVPTSR